jgi:hypothetical protein
LEVKLKPSQTEHLSGVTLLGRLQALPTNIGPGRIALQGKNTSLFDLFISDEKCFKTLMLDVNVVKLFSSLMDMPK